MALNEGMSMFHRILVAVDSSPDSAQVFNKACTVAKQNSAHLIILHVLSPEEEGYPSLPGLEMSLGLTLQERTIKDYLEQLEVFKKDGMDLLQSYFNQAVAAGVDVEISQKLGSPGPTICDAAHSWKSDLIVTGRRGRSRLGELILGSVSNYVLHHAPCSVLIVHRQFEEQ
jgi:nucleotide-binding universal stress UspA family protein